MCCISASFDKDTLISMIQAGSYRGGHSYSITTLNSNLIKTIKKCIGNTEKLLDDVERLNFLTNDYVIVHQQAPTTSERTISNVHPSAINGSLMWHNGILKQTTLDEYNQKYGSNVKWDTAILHMMYLDGCINSVTGGFACLYKNNDVLQIFRNDIVSIFVDKYLNISSVSCLDTMKLLESNIIFNVDLLTKSLVKTDVFKTHECVYYIPE